MTDTPDPDLDVSRFRAAVDRLVGRAWSAARWLLVRANVIARSIVTQVTFVGAVAAGVAIPVQQLLPDPYGSRIGAWLIGAGVVCTSVVVIIRNVSRVIDAAVGLLPPDELNPAEWIATPPNPSTRRPGPTPTPGS